MEDFRHVLDASNFADICSAALGIVILIHTVKCVLRVQAVRWDNDERSEGGI